MNNPATVKTSDGQVFDHLNRIDKRFFGGTIDCVNSAVRNLLW